MALRFEVTDTDGTRFTVHKDAEGETHIQLETDELFGGVVLTPAETSLLVSVLMRAG